MGNSYAGGIRAVFGGVTEPLNDCRNTVLITGLEGHLSQSAFLKAFESYGNIKLHKESGKPLAEMKKVIDGSEQEGIVTYEDKSSAENAINMLNGKDLHGKTIYVKTADNYFYGRLPPNYKVPWGFENLAWRLWKEEGLRKDGGGRGGKGGGHTWVSGKHGNPGKPGEQGPGGQGGEGGKSAI